MRKIVSNKNYCDGRQRIIFIRTGQEKLVINSAYGRTLNRQVKLFPSHR